MTQTGAVFLSASVPLVDRGHYHETADPFLIQSAVRELVLATIHYRHLVWGGHPAITPMVWAICADLGLDYSKAVTLYQSTFFRDRFPEENKHFGNVVYVEAAGNSREDSLDLLRRTMFSRDDLTAAVFIGGMEGVLEEFHLFNKLQPNAKSVAVGSPGGAALDLAKSLYPQDPARVHDVDYARLFFREFPPPAPTPETRKLG